MARGNIIELQARHLREARVRMLARTIAATYHGRPIEDVYLFGEATGGRIFVNCAEAALAEIEAWRQ